MTVLNLYFDWLHISLVVGIFLLIILGLLLAKAISILSKPFTEELDRLKRYQANDQLEMLHAYARDTANEIILRDEQNFARNFAELCDEWKEIETKTLADKEEVLQEIVKEHPSYKDFNLNCSKLYVLAADGFDWESDEGLRKHYRDIRIYISLISELNPTWKKSPGIFPDELEEVRKYCNRVTDTKLLAHLHRAKEHYDIFRFSKEWEESDTGEFETAQYLIKPTDSIAGIAYGAYVKEMDMYGKWDTFYDEKTYVTYYKSDASFKLEKPFDRLTCRYSLVSELFSIKSYSHDYT